MKPLPLFLLASLFLTLPFVIDIGLHSLMRAPIFTILVDGVAATATKRAMEEVNVAVDGDVPPAYILRKFFFFFLGAHLCFAL